MAQVPSMYDLSPMPLSFEPGTLPVPQGLPVLPPAPEEAPIPYSPEGWNQSKLMPNQAEETAATPAGKGAKKPAVNFTPDQMKALSSLLMGGSGAAPTRMSAPAAPRNQVGQMGQLQAGGPVTAKRSSLGQIIYGKGQ